MKHGDRKREFRASGWIWSDRYSKISVLLRRRLDSLDRARGRTFTSVSPLASKILCSCILVCMWIWPACVAHALRDARARACVREKQTSQRGGAREGRGGSERESECGKAGTRSAAQSVAATASRLHDPRAGEVQIEAVWQLERAQCGVADGGQLGHVRACRDRSDTAASRAAHR
eukprot:5249446-Pleurochrysis_carterae.AAC.2